MRVALVYDRVNKWGGAERVLLALHRMFPDAPLFTAVYDAKRATWADVFTVHTTFLQRVPFARTSHELFALVTPMAFETFSFDGYDLVISVTSAEAKNIRTKPGCTHICYCLTPTRYLWSGYEQYLKDPGLGIFSPLASFVLKSSAPLLRSWDLVASNRPDHYIAISEKVMCRLQTYYRKDVHAVIHPPVDTQTFNIQRTTDNSKQNRTGREGYFLTVSRLVSYKRVDVLIDAFNTLKLPLVIVGDGMHRETLQKKAGPTIRFVTEHLTEEELLRYYRESRAFVFAAEEDFGLSAAEAQACGIPVIAYKDSGVSDFVREGVSGVLFDKQSARSVMDAVTRFETLTFDPKEIRKQVLPMSEQHFSDTMMRVIQEVTKTKKV